MKTESEDITKYAICSIKWKDDGVIGDNYVFKLSLDLENKETIAEMAVEQADALIAELKKGE